MIHTLATLRLSKVDLLTSPEAVAREVMYSNPSRKYKEVLRAMTSNQHHERKGGDDGQGTLLPEA